MATYQQLVGSSFTDLVVPFVSYNGIGTYDTNTTTLTGYTLPNTPFTFTSQLSSLENTYIGASMDKLVWDFGDGTYSRGINATKHYKYPGEYDVTTILTDQNGVTHRNTMSQKIKVMNYVPDSLVWYTPTISDPRGGLPEKCKCGVPSDDLTIYRMSSWQSWPAVSADGGYYINLYSTGSKSRPLTPEQYWSNADTHFVPSWRFVLDKTSREPVERVQTTNEYIYVKVENDELVRASEYDPTAFFAGTSGAAVVHYLDDNANRLTSGRAATGTGNQTSAFANENLPDAEYQLAGVTNEDRDIVLYASYDTNKFPVTIYDGELATYGVHADNYFQMYETQKVGMPIQVKFNTPWKLSITSNGIPDFNIEKDKFLDSPISLAIRTMDLSGNIVVTDDIVPLSSRWLAPTTAFSGLDTTTDVITSQGFVTVYLSGQDSEFNTVDTPFDSEEDFKTWDVGEIKPNNEANTYIRVVPVDRRTGVPRGCVLRRYDMSTNQWLEVPNDYSNKQSQMSVSAEQPTRTDILWCDTTDILMSSVTIMLTELVSSDLTNLINTGADKYEWLATPQGIIQTRPYNWTIKNGQRYYGYIVHGDLNGHNISNDESVDMYLENESETFDTPGTYLATANLHSETYQVSFPETKKYRFFAHTLVDPPLSFSYDVMYYYLTNPTNDTLWQVKPVYYRQYSYGDQGTTQTYTPPISTQSPGNSGMYGMCVDYNGDMIAVDGDTDKVIRYWRNQSLRAEFPIRDVLPQSVRKSHYPDDPDAYGYTPSSVSLDKNLDYWVTLYDALSVVKFSGETNEVIASAVPDPFNKLVDSRTTNPEDQWSEHAQYAINQVTGRPGEYGENMITPAVVETCKNNDIVVTYTNPVCSFIMRYNSTGEPLHKYELLNTDGTRDESRYFSGDVCVDTSDHIWALTESTGLTPQGMPDMSEPQSVVYAFDEQLTVRYTISSLQGTDFQDMLKPAPHADQEISIEVRMGQQFDFIAQDVYETHLAIDGYPGENPMVTLYEGNTYHFENLYFMDGKHDLIFQELTPDNMTLPLSTNAVVFDTVGPVVMDSVSGYGTDRVSIEITKSTPSRLLLVDRNFEDKIKLLINVIPKPVIKSRSADSFNKINNATFIIPDNRNNIWFSWGRRYCSRYNPTLGRVDTTVAVGSAYEDPRFDPEIESTHDRRDNADRRSAIEGLSMDTANNLLVVNNHDKILYAINSDTPTLSAYVKISNHQQPYESFTWVESLCSSRVANEQDFLLYPDSHLTKEQIEVFLDGVTLDDESTLQQALTNYRQLSGFENFRTCHGANPVSATGFEQEICAIGDWTGYRWINKYDERIVPSDNATGLVAISGQSEEFSLWPQSGTHQITKINENVDFAGTIRSYMKQPVLRENKVLYETLLDAVFGGPNQDYSHLGKRIYERVSNYVANHNDIDTCTLQALHGLAEMVGYNLIKIGYNMPAEIQRLMDLLSINFTKLRGTLYVEQSDFQKYGNWEQDNIGSNLGPELLFTNDYDSTIRYTIGDYVYYQGEYYECLETQDKAGLTPVDDGWRVWPGGLIKTESIDRVNQIHGDKTPEWRAEYYQQLPSRAKLIQNINAVVGDKYVLREDFSDVYTLVEPPIISVRDGKRYKMSLTGDQDKYYTISAEDNDLSDLRSAPEYLATYETFFPMFTIGDDGVITLIGNPLNSNQTIVLFRNRTYRFDVESFGHPLLITESPGLGAEPVTDYVSDQYVEFGPVVITTQDRFIGGKHVPIPSKLYYQSETDPSISGTIEIRDIENEPGYSSMYDGLTSYNINMSFSAHEDVDKLGWGLEYPDDNSAWQYYSIFEYKQSNDPTDMYHVNNVIDWDDKQTTINYNLSSYNMWVGDTENDPRASGFMDVMIEKELRKGLGLFGASTD